MTSTLITVGFSAGVLLVLWALAELVSWHNRRMLDGFEAAAPGLIERHRDRAASEDAVRHAR